VGERAKASASARRARTLLSDSTISAFGGPLTVLPSLSHRQVVVRVGERAKASAAARGAQEEDAIAADEARPSLSCQLC